MSKLFIQIQYKDGIYQGQLLQNRYKHGIGFIIIYEGVYLWENGCAYFGEWKSDFADGEGILFIPPR